jgi:adenylylsulfate kinase|tara:strand:+ start:2182 stop:2736 length:555 start_codon:yes stop_codon:yes gene_type:complete
MSTSSKILIMGLPGAGKTWFAERLQKALPDCAWFNADVIRKAASDWDFSPAGRERQAMRMCNVADFEIWNQRNVICDFVCPTDDARQAFNADVVIWIDTIKEGRFEDTNKMFENPDLDAVIHIDKHYTEEEVLVVAEQIVKEQLDEYFADNEEYKIDDVIEDEADFNGVFGDSAGVPDFIRRKT